MPSPLIGPQVLSPYQPKHVLKVLNGFLMSLYVNWCQFGILRDELVVANDKVGSPNLFSDP